MDKSITGVVTRVGEQDFELADDRGRRHMFFVVQDIALEAGDLPRLQRDGTRVTVDYDDDTPSGHMAHRVFRAPPETRA